MRRTVLAVPAIVALMCSYMAVPSPLAQAQTSIVARWATGSITAPVINTGKVTRQAPSISNGTLVSALEALQGNSGGAVYRTETATPRRAEYVRGLARAEYAGTTFTTTGVTPFTLGCSSRKQGGDYRVNQDCTYRRQAEEQIRVNPTNPFNLIAGQNDSRIGFNHCGFDYSINGGQSWGDGIPPFWQRLNNPDQVAPHTNSGVPGTNHTYDFASDPAVAFDSSGNAYYTCVVLDINDNASGIYVTRSPAGAGGSFYNNVPAGGPKYTVTEDNSPAASNDKEFITADSYPNSPYKDNVYASWTVFNFSCGSQGTGYCSSKIYFSRSTDHGTTWSPPMAISGISKTLCFFGNFFNPADDPNACDYDQGSYPIVLPNGNVVVVFNNGNTAADNPNSQQLAVVSTNGGQTFSAPYKVGDDVTAGQPVCDFGRACVPGYYGRTNDYPQVGVNRNNGNLYTVWQDYRPGRWAIEMSTSADGGRTWVQAPGPIVPDTWDQSQPAVDVRPDTGTVAVSFYRSQRLPNENGAHVFTFNDAQTACGGPCMSNYVLSWGHGLNFPYAWNPVSPYFPPSDGIQAGFLGDYSGLAIGPWPSTDNPSAWYAYPIWSDTRNVPPAQVGDQGVGHDEDIFTSKVQVPQ